MSASWKVTPTGDATESLMDGVAFDLPLSKLFSLLGGGVSRPRGPVGMSVGRVSVGRNAAGMYIGCRGCRSCRTLIKDEWRLVGEMFVEGGVAEVGLA